MGNTQANPSQSTAAESAAPSVEVAQDYWFRALTILSGEATKPADASDLSSLPEAKAEIERIRCLLRACKSDMDLATGQSLQCRKGLNTRKQTFDVLREVTGQMMSTQEFLDARKKFRKVQKAFAQLVQRWEAGKISGHEVWKKLAASGFRTTPNVLQQR